METTLEEVAQELEFQQQRLGEAVEQFSLE